MLLVRYLDETGAPVDLAGITVLCRLEWRESSIDLAAGDGLEIDEAAGEVTVTISEVRAALLPLGTLTRLWIAFEAGGIVETQGSIVLEVANPPDWSA